MDSKVDAWVAQYTPWCESQIRAVMIKHQLHAQLVRVVRGPMTLTYQIGLLSQSLDKQSLSKLLHLDSVIGLACRTSSVRIYEGENGTINIEIPLPPQCCTTPPAKALVAQTTGPNLCLGFNSMRQPMHIDIRQHGAVLWVGPSRSGKTQSIKSTLYCLLAQPKLEMRFVIIAHKIEDWEDLRDLRQCWGIAHTLDEMQAAKSWLLDELARRTQTKVKRPLIVVVADDMINLVEADPEIGKAMGAIASQGAGVGINLFVGTQEAGSKKGTGDNSVENNVTARLVYRISNTQAASRSAGQGKVGVDKLSGAKGDALFLLHGKPHRIATGYVAEGLFDALPQGAEKAPWLALVGAGQGDQRVVSSLVAPKNQQNQQKPAETSQNQLQTVVVGGEGMWWQEKNGDTRREITHPHPSTLVATSSATIAATSSATTTAASAATEEQEQPVSFPIPRRALTAAEKTETRKLARAGYSKNKLQFTIYGSRDGKTKAWIDEALAEEPSEAEAAQIEAEEAQQQVAAQEPEPEDMDDQALLQMLLAKKAINWDATVGLNRQMRIGAGG